MKKFKVFFALVILLFITGCTTMQVTVPEVLKPSANKNTKPDTENEALIINSDNFQGENMDKWFSFDSAMANVNFTSEVFNEYRILTERVRNDSGVRLLNGLTHTSWYEQYHEFTNTEGILKGTLQKQNYTISKLEYELAKRDFAAGQISKKELEDKKKNFEKNKNDFQSFINNYAIAD